MIHIAFLVKDVRFICDKLLKNGGSLSGEIAKIKISGVGVLTMAYAREPEGNIVEAQNWNYLKILLLGTAAQCRKADGMPSNTRGV